MRVLALLPLLPLAAQAIPNPQAPPTNPNVDAPPTNPNVDPLPSDSSSDASATANSTAIPRPEVMHVPFQGNDSLPQSPDFYPSPEVQGTGDWADAVARARAYLADFSLEEKVNFTTGVGWGGGRCVGNIPPIGDKFPGLCLQDGPLGVRQVEFASAFPAGINVAATFDKDLAYQRALALGEEFYGKGVNVALGPCLDIARTAAGGRGWEGFGADPYLAGDLGAATVHGLQDKGVQATAKHFLLNNQEHFRTTSSSNVDDRAIREIYLHPYLRVVQADISSVMCSYNKERQVWACENSYLLNELLKHDLGFQGYVMSDWQAQHSGVASALAGMDMTMPGDSTFNSGWFWWGANLTAAVNNGSVPESRVDDMAVRVLAPWFRLGQDAGIPETSFNFFDQYDPEIPEKVNVRGNHHEIIREVGRASTVLLKNNGALPLNGWDIKSIGVLGSDAGPSPRGANGFVDRGGLEGTEAMGWGSGSVEFPYLIDPLHALQERGRRESFTVDWSFEDWNLNVISKVATGKDASIVFIHSHAGEEYITVDGNMGDRNNLTAWDNGDAVVLAAAQNCSNTIVVIHSPGQHDIESWVDHENVTAVIWAGLPGQESGNAIVDVLFGDYSPSGRLPFTIAKAREDYGVDVIYEDNSTTPQINYTESIFVDYRHFQQNNIEPRYEFGFGLSYTTFDYSNMQVSAHGSAGQDYDAHIFGASVQPWLHEPVYTITFDVTNTGERLGCEVAQLYLNFAPESGEPPRVLRGFERVNLEPGQTETVTVQLSKYDTSVWSAEEHRWIRPEGEINVVVGASSADDRLWAALPPLA